MKEPRTRIPNGFLWIGFLSRRFSNLKPPGLLALGFMALSIFPISAQSRLPAQINVTGSAEIKVTPDEVDLEVGVETRHEHLDEAKKQNDDRIAKALQFLKNNGIKEKNIQTDFVIIEPVYDTSVGVNPQTGLPIPGLEKIRMGVDPAYYQVRKSIGIRLTEISRFDALLSGLVDNGVNHVRRIDFRTSELRQHKDQARAMALAAAKEKAEAAASKLGVKLGKPSGITLNDWGGWNGWAPQTGWGYGGGGAAGPASNASLTGFDAQEVGATLAVGQISISAQVTVSFIIR